MGKISRFLFGAYEISVHEECAKAVFNILLTNGIPFGRTHEEDGAVSFCLTKRGFRAYKNICGGELLFGEKAELIGLFGVLSRYRLRTGMFLGLIIFLLSVMLSSLFVWDINIKGNESITESEITERLDAYGFRLGAFIPRLDTDDICERIILETGTISFMKINMRGTVASVEIHEQKDEEEFLQDSSPSNLVAKYDAQIERAEVTGGIAAVSYLQVVKKGELLVSGIIDSEALGYRLVRARGKVFGKVELHFESRVPFQNEKKVYTGKENTEKSIKFFSKSLNLSKNGGIPYEKYDTIESNRKLYLFGIVELPIFVCSTTYKEYENEPYTLSNDEAYKKALTDIEEKSRDVLADAQILSRDMHLSTDENALYITLDVECILDIAEEIKIETARR